MRATVLYDLADPVELTPEEEELFFLVNRGRASALAGKVIVQTADGQLYLTKRPNRAFQRLLVILWVVAACLAVVSVLLLALGGLMVLTMPFEFPPVLSLFVYLVFILLLLFADRFKN